MALEQELDFIVEVTPSGSPTTKSILSGRSEDGREHRLIPVSKLQVSLRGVVQGLSTALKDLRAVGDFELNEVTVEAEVNAEGGISLLGSGGKAGIRGAITLKFVQKV